MAKLVGPAPENLNSRLRRGGSPVKIPLFMRPSVLYRGGLWRLGLGAARTLPPRLLESIGQFFALAYCHANRTRREIVTRNLLPALQFDRSLAEEKTRRLFRNFGLKLADLWRYESGQTVAGLDSPTHAWPEFRQLHQRGRGVLLVTPHIGNWEVGALFLKQQGIEPLVITQAEPQQKFTQQRASSRLGRGIQTLVIGENPFAFVEVIRRLEEGAVIALLVDRPAPATAVIVKVFGHKFAASKAAAELARASGCAILPVVVPRTADGYTARLLPEIQYERAALGNHEARANMTQEMMRQFEPCIREYIDQWYHFVPVWQNDMFG